MIAALIPHQRKKTKREREENRVQWAADRQTGWAAITTVPELGPGAISHVGRRTDRTGGMKPAKEPVGGRRDGDRWWYPRYLPTRPDCDIRHSMISFLFERMSSQVGSLLLVSGCIFVYILSLSYTYTQPHLHTHTHIYIYIEKSQRGAFVGHVWVRLWLWREKGERKRDL